MGVCIREACKGGSYSSDYERDACNPTYGTIRKFPTTNDAGNSVSSSLIAFLPQPQLLKQSDFDTQFESQRLGARCPGEVNRNCATITAPVTKPSCASCVLLLGNT
eukprot:48499-Amphidinium_carterae.1